jgi:hypothetical protein
VKNIGDGAGIDNWQRLANSGIQSEATIASSQSVIGEKYLVKQLQRTVGNGLQRAESPARISSVQSKCDW